MQMLFCENLNSTKLIKNLLGGLVVTEAELSGYSGPFLWCILEYVHLWMATQGTEESEELRVTIASSAAIAIWALA